MYGHGIRTRILTLREENGESQEDVAKGIGESRETVRNWEVGTRKIKAESIVKLAKHFGVSSDYLLGLSEVKSAAKNIQTAIKVTGLSEKAVERLDSDVCPNVISFLLECDEFVYSTVMFIDQARRQAASIPECDYSFLDSDKWPKELAEAVKTLQSYGLSVGSEYENVRRSIESATSSFNDLLKDAFLRPICQRMLEKTDCPDAVVDRIF